MVVPTPVSGLNQVHSKHPTPRRGKRLALTSQPMPVTVSPSSGWLPETLLVSFLVQTWPLMTSLSIMRRHVLRLRCLRQLQRQQHLLPLLGRQVVQLHGTLNMDL